MKTFKPKTLLTLLIILQIALNLKLAFANSAIPSIRIVPYNQIDFQIGLLILVVIIETYVMKVCLNYNFYKLLSYVFVANLVSYFIGFIGICFQIAPIFHGSVPPLNNVSTYRTFVKFIMKYELNISTVTIYILGYSLAWIIFLIISFLVSTFIEFMTIYLLKLKFDLKTIAYSCIKANIISYLVLTTVFIGYNYVFFNSRYNQLELGMAHVEQYSVDAYQNLTINIKNENVVKFSIKFITPFKKLSEQLNVNKILITEKISEALKDKNVEAINNDYKSMRIHDAINKIIFSIIKLSDVEFSDDEKLNKHIMKIYHPLNVNIYNFEIIPQKPINQDNKVK